MSKQRYKPFKQVYAKRPPIYSASGLTTNTLYFSKLVKYNLRLRINLFATSLIPHLGEARRALSGTNLISSVSLGYNFFSCAANSFCRKVAAGLRLPSGTFLSKSKPIHYLAYTRLGLTTARAKSSNTFYSKKKIAVRGVAKNANDHSNGGKGRGGILRGF